MARADRADGSERHLLLVGGDAAARRELRGHLAAPPGRSRAADARPRFTLITASVGSEALRRATPRVTVAAIDLAPARRDALVLVRALRARRPDLAILAFTRGASGSEAAAAVLAGADFFHDCGDLPDPGAFERALELAVERRRLSRLVQETEAAAAGARARLAQLSGERAGGGLRPPAAKEDVLPFKEAARLYLTASAGLFEGDTRGLARALGISYFALRRLLARYEVPLPSRSRKHGTSLR
jgi:CheY-like chemotaxis protein